MTRTMRILTLLAVMTITAGQVWAEEPTYGIIHYTQGSTDGGSLCFSTTLEKTYNAQTDFNGSGVSSGNDRIYTYTVTGNILTDGKVYVRAVPNFGYTVTDMTLIVEPSAPSSTAEAPRRGAPGVASTIPVTPVEGHSGVYTFPMPTDGTNVTVTASFPVSTPINVDYLDATGTKKTAQAYVLDGAELYLGESGQEFWYVCNSDIDYRTQLRLHGDAHLILADGKTMTISAGNQHAIDAENGVTIHGQSGASGKLIAEATSGEGIYSKGDITIISADVSVTSTSSYAVRANPGNITITDSKVTVNGGLDGFVATNVSDNTTKGNITINGSQVTAIGGSHANDYGINAAGGDITLGWKNTTDFIKASSYFIEGSGNVKTAAGKRFIAYNMASEDDISASCIIGDATDETTLDAETRTAIAGKTLRPLDGYYVKDKADITLSGKSAPDFTINNIPYYIYKASTEQNPISVVVSVTGHGDDHMAITTTPVVNQTDDEAFSHCFAMPAQDVTINGIKYYNYGVDYLDWNATQKTSPENTKVWHLDGTETTLPGGWYLAKGEVSYTGQLKFTDEAHLILTDGCEMTVGTSENPINDNAIYTNKNLTIYGQSTGKDMGKLNAHSENGNGICAYSNDSDIYIMINGGQVTATGGSYYDGICAFSSYSGDLDLGNANIAINGGQVTANGGSNGINAYSDYRYANVYIAGGQVTANGGSNGIYATTASGGGAITIYRGQVTAIGGNNGIYCYSFIINDGQVTATGGSNGYGIYAYSDDANAQGYIYIEGGQVTVAGEDKGIFAEYDIVLGWTNTDDFIKVSNYNGTVKTLLESVIARRFVVYNGDNAVSYTAASDYWVTLNPADINGKTLRPLDGYVVKDLAGITLSDKTAPDFTITDTPYYIYKANNEVTLTTPNYGQNGVELTGTNVPTNVTLNDALTQASFAMPAEDITINGVKYYNTGVKYMDWDDTQKKHVEKTTDANTKVYILTGGGATDLPGGWYVVNNWNTDENVNSGIDAAYTGQLKFTGDANLILSDGSEMTVTPASDYAIYAEKCSLAIYGQSIDAATMGSLTASSSNSYCIYAYTNTENANTGITINGGRLTATSTNNIGILARSNTGTATLAFNGGCVNASGTYSAINAYSPNGTAITTISGGQVTATATASNGYAIYANRDGGGNGKATIILSLTKSSDYITANSYSATGSVKIPAGKALAYTDGTTTVLGNTAADYVFGSGTNATLASIAGQTLRMSKNMPVSAVSAQYAALYQEDGDWKVTDPDVKMYVPTGNIIKNGNAYEMELKEVTGGGIPNGVPVILGKEGGLGDIPVVGTSADEANAIETNYNNTESEIEQKHKDEHTVPALTLFATNTTETLAQQIINAASPKDDLGNVIEETKVDPNDYVVLGIVNGKLTTLSANQTAVPLSTQPVVVISKFDLLQMIRGTYTAPTSNAPSIVIDLGDVTGISDIKHESINIKSDDAWYSLDGRRIANGQQPTAKGIYINGGRKVVVR